MGKFVREERYIVLKLSDLTDGEYLTNVVQGWSDIP